eukprot:1207849-Pyramimonas_sp.AAC.1
MARAGAAAIRADSLRVQRPVAPCARCAVGVRRHRCCALLCGGRANRGRATIDGEWHSRARLPRRGGPALRRGSA